MGNIGKVQRKITLVPMPDDVPVPEVVPEPVREPEPVPVGELAIAVNGGVLTGSLSRS